MVPNRYGRFSQDARSFTITDRNAPSPWCNVMCNGEFGVIVSHNGGGFSWHQDAQHNVLTRWEMDLVRDCYGKFLYLADHDSGDIWSVAPAPCNTPHEQYACTHEAGATTFRTKAHDITSEWCICVSPTDSIEVWTLRLTNTSPRPRRLRVSSYFEWTCGVAPDAKREFHRLFFTTRHDPARRAIVATKNMWDIPGTSEKDHWNIDWPYVAAHAVCGPGFERDIAIANKSAFLGRYGSTARPLVMQTSTAGATPLTGGFGRFGDACAALGGDVTLAPGEVRTVHYVIAIAKDQPGLEALLDAYRDPVRAGKVPDEARASWARRLSPTTVASSAPDIDAMHNHWLPYQAISARLWGRTGYYQQSGARGYRDQLQDSQVWLSLEPQRTAEQILLHASRQFPDGSVNHWWHELANFGNHTECSDDYLWLPFMTAAYLRETGDSAILERTAPFLPEKRGAVPTSGTLLDHCQRAIERSFVRMSPRGLPLIGSCDWNDGLSALGLEGKGESIWLAMFLCSILDDWAIILARRGDVRGSDLCAQRRKALETSIEAHAWDGRHYRCATKDSGEWIGASSSPEGKIHLNPQTWSILANVGSHERRDAAWKSVKEHLLTPYGPLLLAPAYTIPDGNIGYITRYAPGTRENGGVYMHAATWALAAACKVRDRDTADRIWQSICPPTRSGPDPEAYIAEPYVLPGNVDGPLSERPGKAGWTWYTGSAAWLRRVCQEWMLGIRAIWTPRGEGLLIDPMTPARLGSVRVQRLWRGRRIVVVWNAGECDPGRSARVTVLDPQAAGGGRLLAGGVLDGADLASTPAGGTIEVRVEWA